MAYFLVVFSLKRVGRFKKLKKKAYYVYRGSTTAALNSVCLTVVSEPRDVQAIQLNSQSFS